MNPTPKIIKENFDKVGTELEHARTRVQSLEAKHAHWFGLMKEYGLLEPQGAVGATETRSTAALMYARTGASETLRQLVRDNPGAPSSKLIDMFLGGRPGDNYSRIVPGKNVRKNARNILAYLRRNGEISLRDGGWYVVPIPPLRPRSGMPR